MVLGAVVGIGVAVGIVVAVARGSAIVGMVEEVGKEALAGATAFAHAESAMQRTLTNNIFFI